MRTTVTLDADIVEQLKSTARRRNVSFKKILNETVRAGLAAERNESRPYKLQPKNLGLPRIDLTHALRIADALEDEEGIRRLQSSK